MNARLFVRLNRKPEPADPGKWVYPLVLGTVLILALLSLTVGN